MTIFEKNNIMQDDPEIKAMQLSYTAIKELEDDGKLRVINWLIAKFAITINNSSTKNDVNSSSREVQQNTDTVQGNQLSSFTLLAELFSCATPKTDVEKVLVVAVYLQETQGLTELTSRAINDELKHLGHGPSNITLTISTLTSRKPNLMIQTRKEGKTQQAQKKYRVTVEGIKQVMEMIKNKNI